MSLDADALAEMARNRGLKLKRSRVRTPGKPGFGMFGLVDAGDNPVFGIRGKRALRADADEIEAFLRKEAVSDWKASLRQSGASAKRAGKPAPAAPVQAAPPPPRPKKAKPPTPPKLRDAKPADAEQIAALFAMLEHPVEGKTVARNIMLLGEAGEPLLVLAQEKKVLGVCGVHRMVTPHRNKPVGRITVLIVAEEVRDRGYGRKLIEEAERRLDALGCGLIEVTSNDRLSAAHAFYRHMGFERTSMRFAKPVGSG